MRFVMRSSQGESAEGLRLRDAIFAAVKAARRGGMAIVGEGAPDAEDEAVMAACRHWQRKYGDEEWEPFRRDANAAWELVRPRVEEWFASTETVEGALARAREQRAAPSVPRHWPDPTLVAAFALARLGATQKREACSPTGGRRAGRAWRSPRPPRRTLHWRWRR
jgi:hypothetical protein